MGTAYAIEHFLKAFNWDAKTRDFVLSAEPGKIEVITDSVAWLDGTHDLTEGRRRSMNHRTDNNCLSR